MYPKVVYNGVEKDAFVNLGGALTSTVGNAVKTVASKIPGPVKNFGAKAVETAKAHPIATAGAALGTGYAAGKLASDKTAGVEFGMDAIAPLVLAKGALWTATRYGGSKVLSRIPKVRKAMASLAGAQFEQGLKGVRTVSRPTTAATAAIFEEEGANALVGANRVGLRIRKRNPELADKALRALRQVRADSGAIHAIDDAATKALVGDIKNVAQDVTGLLPEDIQHFIRPGKVSRTLVKSPKDLVADFKRKFTTAGNIRSAIEHVDTHANSPFFLPGVKVKKALERASGY